MLAADLSTLGGVIISEFMASNGSSLADDDGDHPDWIELHNEGMDSVNIDGWYLTDDPANLRKWRLPEVTIPAKGFLIVFASGKNRTNDAGELHTSFSLNASGEYLGLIQPDGETVAYDFSPKFTSQERNVSYGPAQIVAKQTLISRESAAKLQVPNDGSIESNWILAEFDAAHWIDATPSIGYERVTPGFLVRNFKANGIVDNLASAEAVISNTSRQLHVTSENSAIINFYGTGAEGHYSGNRPFPGSFLGQDLDDFVVEAIGTVSIPSSGVWTFGVSSDDGFSLQIGGHSISYPNPRAPGDTLGVFNFPEAGEVPLRLVFYERGGGSELELFAAKGAFSSWSATGFRLLGDTESGGLKITSPVAASGSPESFRSIYLTDVQSLMEERNSSVYIRIPFTVENPDQVEVLRFRTRYDGGFVSYLNGVEVARRNAPDSVAWNAVSAGVRPRTSALEWEEINLTSAASLLVGGTNVLCVQGLNESKNDPDYLLSLELHAYQISIGNAGHFATPTPGDFNGIGSLSFVGDTKFSHDRGFYDNPFELTISSETPGATIRYTTNGVSPTPNSGVIYTAPVSIAGTTVIRAVAFKEGYQPSDVDTQTYLFLDDVIRQSPTGAPPAGWPTSWGVNVVDYGMDPDVINHPAYSATIKDDLKSIPTISLVIDLKHLFDPVTGIYANPSGEGRAWERPASIELIYPDGTAGFQVEAGVRIRGGFSRSPSNPKHAFRLFFRNEYGDAKLRYELFGREGANEFDAIDLRTFQNYSWSFQGDGRGIFVRDQFSRDAQLAMGHAGERGKFYHLYINGQYWGLYNTCERPEASYGETYFGGKKEDYDVIKVESGTYTISATDGDMNAWTRLYNFGAAGLSSDSAYYRIQGKNPDGTRNPDYENLIDIPNLIDYMLIIFYGGNLDAPISNFLGNTSPNNWYGMRNRIGQEGFRFFIHDAEHTLLDVNSDRTGPYPAGNATNGGGMPKSNPQWLFQQLQANAEFRTLVGDRVHRHFFNFGALTPSRAAALFLARKAEIDRAVVGESARWGDAKHSVPLTRNVDWVNAVNAIMTGFIPQRTGVVLNQLRAKSLYPAVAAPVFSRHGGVIPGGFTVSISSTSPVYYTRDNSDPRLIGGAISPSAARYEMPLVVNESGYVKARALSGGMWSALNEAAFVVQQTFTDVLPTEIMYHPPDQGSVDGDEFEFIELKNLSDTSRDLSGAYFTNGLSHVFPGGTVIGPGQFIVLVSNAPEFQKRYPNVPVEGVYTGRLANGGEKLRLVHASGGTIFSITYSDDPPWPVSADGQGFSIVPVNPELNADLNDPANWRASSQIGGSPGAGDVPAALGSVWITEVLTHTDPPQVDSIELYNPGAAPVDISGWFMTDERMTPKKYRIADETVISAGAYLVFTESEFNPSPGVDPSFSLNSWGEEVYLYSADSAGNLTGYSDGFAFGAAENGVSFGRYTTSDGELHYPAQSALTLGAPNAGPRIGPVVINEIRYHPRSGDEEFVEVKNISSSPVKLYDPEFSTNTWRLDGVSFTFPLGAEIPANGLAVIAASDPAAFRSRHNLPDTVPVFGPYNGVLQDSGERLQLVRPDSPDLVNGTNVVPYIVVDEVRYNDKAPWPTDADGLGPSIERMQSGSYGDDPANWRASPGIASPGRDNDGNRPPEVWAGADQTATVSEFPHTFAFSGIAADDGRPSPPGALGYAWSQISGPSGITFSDAQELSCTASFPEPGEYILRFTVSDGELEMSDTVVARIDRATYPITLVPRGAMWKYSDDGTTQKAGWATSGFDDEFWKEGNAELGYGDGDEATVIGFGPNETAKFITSYFRRSFTVSRADSVKELTLNLLRDDGGMVYLNGTEVFRSNMPDGEITASTRSSSTVGGADESRFFETKLDPSLLVSGHNVIAVEIHQTSGDSSDLSFDLELSGRSDEDTIRIGGTIKYYSGTVKVSSAAVQVSGDADVSVRTDGSGTFGIELSPGGSYAIEPSMADTSPVQGVTTLDIGLIRRHILGLSEFDSPYKLIASDVNDSGSTTTLDIALIRRVILGVVNGFPGANWKFVRSDYQFPNPAMPWSYSPSRIYNGLVADLLSEDFIGIKMGDVNGSWTPPLGAVLSDALSTQILGRSNVTIQRVAQDADEITIQIQTVAGRIYLLESCHSLPAPKWREIARVKGTGKLEVLRDSTSSIVQRFYRVQVESEAVSR